MTAPTPRTHTHTHHPTDDVDFAFARSSGPGGQNVNKVNTKVDMRWQIGAAGWVPGEVKDAIARAVSSSC